MATGIAHACVPFDNIKPNATCAWSVAARISGCWRTLAGAAAVLALRSYVLDRAQAGYEPVTIS
jgi:hypothetical protein